MHGLGVSSSRRKCCHTRKAWTGSIGMEENGDSRVGGSKRRRSNADISVDACVPEIRCNGNSGRSQLYICSTVRGLCQPTFHEHILSHNLCCRGLRQYHLALSHVVGFLLDVLASSSTRGTKSMRIRLQRPPRRSPRMSLRACKQDICKWFPIWSS